MRHSITKKILQSLNQNSGFTIVETFITMAIFTIVMTGLYATVAVGESSWQVNQANVELQQQLRQGMGWMINDLRSSGNSSIVNVPANDTLYTTITFKVPTGVTAGSLVWAANTIQFVLGGSGGTDLQRIEGGVTTVIAQNIQTLQFRRSSSASDTLEVFMTAQRTTAKGNVMAAPLDFSIQLRN